MVMEKYLLAGIEKMEPQLAFEKCFLMLHTHKWQEQQQITKQTKRKLRIACHLNGFLKIQHAIKIQ